MTAATHRVARRGGAHWATPIAGLDAGDPNGGWPRRGSPLTSYGCSTCTGDYVTAINLARVPGGFATANDSPAGPGGAGVAGRLTAS